MPKRIIQRVKDRLKKNGIISKTKRKNYEELSEISEASGDSITLRGFNKPLYYSIERNTGAEPVISIVTGDKKPDRRGSWRETNTIVLTEVDRISSLSGEFPIYEVEIIENGRVSEAGVPVARVSLDGAIIIPGRNVNP